MQKKNSKNDKSLGVFGSTRNRKALRLAGGAIATLIFPSPTPALVLLEAIVIFALFPAECAASRHAAPSPATSRKQRVHQRVLAVVVEKARDPQLTQLLLGLRA